MVTRYAITMPPPGADRFDAHCEDCDAVRPHAPLADDPRTAHCLDCGLVRPIETRLVDVPSSQA